MHTQVLVPPVADPALAPIVAVLARARQRQREMVRAHYRAAGRRLTATGLAQAAGCRHYAFANRWVRPTRQPGERVCGAARDATLAAPHACHACAGERRRAHDCARQPAPRVGHDDVGVPAHGSGETGEADAGGVSGFIDSPPRSRSNAPLPRPIQTS